VNKTKKEARGGYLLDCGAMERKGKGRTLSIQVLYGLQEAKNGMQEAIPSTLKVKYYLFVPTSALN